MSRGLKGFLTFCALLALVAGGIAIYLGPHKLAFIFHKQRSVLPFVMLDLVKFKDAAAREDFRNGFQQPLRVLYDGYGAEILYTGTTTRVDQGNSRDEWQLLEFVEWPSRAAFIELVTSPEYTELARVREAETSQRAWIAASPKAELKLTPNGAYALRLLSFENAAARRDFLSRTDQATAGDTHIGVSAAQLNTLEAPEDQQWQYLQVYSFPDTRTRELWLNDEVRKTQWSLQRKFFERDVLLSIDWFE